VCADGAYAVREILLWTLYRGEVVWNRQRKRDRWGVKKYLDRPERGRFYGCSFNQTPAGSARFTSSAGSELDLPFEGAALCG
jgi:hypothetical protein